MEIESLNVLASRRIARLLRSRAPRTPWWEKVTLVQSIVDIISPKEQWTRFVIFSIENRKPEDLHFFPLPARGRQNLNSIFHPLSARGCYVVFRSAREMLFEILQSRSSVAEPDVPCSLTTGGTQTMLFSAIYLFLQHVVCPESLFFMVEGHRTHFPHSHEGDCLPMSVFFLSLPESCSFVIVYPATNSVSCLMHS
jgi:hypothetical protein